jgi:hypothetical protein
LVALVPVAGVVALNFATYGQPLINDQTSGSSAAAMSALQSAAAPYSRSRVPVPKQARDAIYRVSPTFALLKPTLDPEKGLNVWSKFGCEQDKSSCGDIGGWFIWAFRDAIANIGGYASPQKADEVYNAIDVEVRTACASGSLTCPFWPIAMMPPPHLSQARDILRSSWRMAKLLLFTQPINTTVPPSSVERGLERQLYEMVGSPHVIGSGRTITLSGWFYSRGDAWFEAKGAQLSRAGSPDVAAYFSDPAASNQRFVMQIECPNPQCSVEINGLSVDVSAVTSGSEVSLTDGKLHFDEASQLRRSNTHRTIPDAWLSISSASAPVFAATFCLGAIAFLFMLLRDFKSQALSTQLVVCAALWGAVAGRSIILILADAVYMDAVTYAYALPIFPLLTAASVTSLVSLFQHPTAPVYSPRKLAAEYPE